MTYGNLIKLKANSDYIIRLSDNGEIGIWSNKNYSYLINLKAGAEVLEES